MALRQFKILVCACNLAGKAVTFFLLKTVENHGIAALFTLSVTVSDTFATLAGGVIHVKRARTPIKFLQQCNLDKWEQLQYR